MNKILLPFFFILLIFPTAAQDLSKVDLSKLTPEQTALYQQYMASKSSGSVSQAAQEERTAPAASQLSGSNSTVFGSYLFNTQNLSFEPNLNIATPANYVIGINDELVVDVSGLYDANYRLTVSPEGTIRIPNVGPIKVNGKTIDDCSRLIKSEVSKVYQGVQTGETRINISLGKIRSIKITVIGDAVRPGTYTLPSLATAFNGIYACGGPTETGSMRSINIIRGNKIISTIDVYKFIKDGVIANNVILHDGDVIKFDTYKVRVTINGPLKHTGKFELNDNETLKDLIDYTGGFKEDAYSELATVVRINDNQRKVIDVDYRYFKSFKIISGDEISFSGLLDKFSNKVEISGAINRPGQYSIDNGLTVKQLIDKALGLKEDAYLNMAFITRKKENQVPEILTFNLGSIIKGEISDIELKKDDKLEIKNIFDYRQNYNVTISGEIKSPGTFPLVDNFTLRGLIAKANGFTDAALTDSIELIRIIKDKKLLQTSNQKAIVKKFKIDKNLSDSTQGNILLEDGDQIVVRKISGYETLRMVSVEGEVLRPGRYNIISKTEYVSDLLLRTGGLTHYAYPEGAYLIRTLKLNPTQRRLYEFMAESTQSQLQKANKSTIDIGLLQQAGISNIKDISSIDSLQAKLAGSDMSAKIIDTEGLVGINLKKIMNSPRGEFDLKLEEGDIIYVPRKQETVRILGEVYFPTYVQYNRNKRLRKYLTEAGGFAPRASKSRIFVLYANGTSKSTVNFLGIKFYPRILPGSQIIVPQKPINIQQKMSTGEIIALFSSTTSMAALIYSIISTTLSNNN